MGMGLQTARSVRPQGGARVRLSGRDLRAQELHFPGGLAQAPEAELSEGRDLRTLSCEALVQPRVDGWASEGQRGLSEAKLPVPGKSVGAFGEATEFGWPPSDGFPPLGRPLCHCAGPQEPGAGEVLLPHGEDHRKAAGLAAVRSSGSLGAGWTWEERGK